MTELTPKLPRHVVAKIVAHALEKNLSVTGDITTTTTITTTVTSAADVVPHQNNVVASLPIATYVFETISQGHLRVEFNTADGTQMSTNKMLATIHKPVRNLLTAERTALNVLGHLSNIATLTHH